MACDPNFSLVSLLLPCDGANGSTSFPDLSNNGLAVTASGASVSTAQAMFGTGSAYFAGFDTFLNAPVSAGSPLDLATGQPDFTVEYWFYPTTLAAPFGQVVHFDLTDAAHTLFRIYTVGSGNLTAQFFGGYANIGSFGSIGLPTLNAWNHIAVVRSGTSLKIYLNGVNDPINGVATITSNIPAPTLNTPLYVGAGYNSNIQFTGINSGYIDELRITKGLARYTANFTPPVAAFGLSCVPQTTVPDVTGDSIATATAAIVAASLVVSSEIGAPGPLPAGTVTGTSPAAGTQLNVGASVVLLYSTGVTRSQVPKVTGLTAANANAALIAAGFVPGPVSPADDPNTPIGSISTQGVPAYSYTLPGTPVGMTVSVLDVPFNVAQTVISQYANSPVILRLVNNMAQYVDQSDNFANFYAFLWNVDTAQGFGLDVWGRIVGVSRLLKLPPAGGFMGFQTSDVPPDWQPWGQAPFYAGPAGGQSYVLSDSAYRVLILTKALANICATTGPALNQLLKNLFPGRGRAYTLDLGAMQMRFVFEFSLTVVEFAILTQSGALPHPAGVGFSVVSVPVGGGGRLGFSEAGPAVFPFGFGVFYSPP